MTALPSITSHTKPQPERSRDPVVGRSNQFSRAPSPESFPIPTLPPPPSFLFPFPFSGPAEVHRRNLLPTFAPPISSILPVGRARKRGGRRILAWKTRI